MKSLCIATRGSKLALWQAEHVRALLEAEEPGLAVRLLVLKTQGDQILDRPLQEVGGKGLFTREIEDALLDGRAQLAVHSLKDLPALSPPGLLLGAVPRREDPRDALLCRPGLREAVRQAASPLSALPTGARLGTSSLRRLCQLRRLRPDLAIVPLRGNVDTRLRKIDAGELDAAVLAVAGLARLGHRERIDAVLSTADSLPAVGQGALALQCREDDAAARKLLARLEDPAARVAVDAERAFLGHLGGDCRTPLAAHGTLTGDTLTLEGFVADPEGTALVRARVAGPAASAAALGVALAQQLLDAGARAWLEPGGREP